MTKYGRPLAYRYSLVEEFVSGGPYLVGIGNTLTPWIVEGSPPDIDISKPEQPEVAIYLPTIRVEAVIPYPTDTEDTFRIENRFFLPIPNNFASIADAGSVDALIRCKLDHSQLGVGAYRSLGIHDQLTLSPSGQLKLAAGQPVLPSEVLNKRLVFISNLQPVATQPPMIQFINIVIPI